MIKHLNLVVATLLSLNAGLASANPFEQEYRLKDYPATAPACHQIASDLGERLASEHGANIVSTSCLLSQSGVGVDLSVIYTSEDDLFLFSTFDDITFGSQGWYSSRAACLAALPGEEAQFTEATGLRVFNSICQKDLVSYFPTWFPRIDGFGFSTIRHQFEDTPVFGRPVGYSSSSFAAHIKNVLTELGYNMRHVAIDGTMGLSELRLAYYSEESAFFNVKSLALVENASQCQAELGQLRVVLQRSDNTILTDFCSNMLTGGVEIQALLSGDLMISIDNSAEQFTSYGACNTGREATLAAYRNRNRPIVGGICARTEVNERVLPTWSVRLIEPLAPDEPVF
jgi:hypothetical protein